MLICPQVKAKESNDNFEFGRVKMGLQNDTKRTKKRRKESKEDLLAKVSDMTAYQYLVVP